MPTIDVHRQLYPISRSPLRQQSCGNSSSGAGLVIARTAVEPIILVRRSARKPHLQCFIDRTTDMGAALSSRESTHADSGALFQLVSGLGCDIVERPAGRILAKQ